MMRASLLVNDVQLIELSQDGHSSDIGLTGIAISRYKNVMAETHQSRKLT